MQFNRKYGNEFWVVKLLKWGVYLVAFAPLIIFSQFISPFHVGKVLIFRSLIEIMAVFYFVLVLRDSSYLPRKHHLLTIFTIFTIVFGVSTFISINPYLSFWGSLERMGGWWSFLHYLVYFVILTSLFKTKEDWLRLTKFMVLSGVLSAFYGFGQKTNIDFFIGSGGRTRIFGTIGNAALFAGYQIVVLFLSLTLAASSWVNIKHKGYFYAAALINSIALLMTAVRGSILGFGVGLLIFSGLYFINFKSKTAKRALLTVVSLAVLFAAFSLMFRNSGFVKSSGYLSRLTDFSLKTRTVNTRFWAWQAGIEGWRENPKTVLFGWGPENFDVPFSKHFNPKFFQGIGSETLFDRAHNMFVEILVTMGLFAFLFYVSLFVMAYHIIWKRLVKGREGPDRVLGIGLISLITAYIIHNCFIFDTSANFIVFFTVLGFIVWLTPQHSADSEPLSIQHTSQHKFNAWQQVLLAFLLVGALYLIYQTNFKQGKVNHMITRAITKAWNGDVNGAFAKYKEALSYDIPGKYEYRHRFAQWVLEYTSGRKLGDTEKAMLKFAIEVVTKNAQESQQDYLPYLYISRANIILGKEDSKSPYNDEALKSSMKALTISSNFIRTYYEIAQAYLNKKEYDNTIKYFKRALELNPTVGLTHWYLGASYLEMGKTVDGLNEVDEAIKYGYAFSESDTLRLINIYVKLGNFEKIAQLYEGLIASKPNNPQYHASLAASYARIGKIDQAVEQARISAQLDKAFEPEAKMFIESLGKQY